MILEKIGEQISQMVVNRLSVEQVREDEKTLESLPKRRKI